MRDSELLSLDEAARYLGVHVKTARRHVREGRLKAFRVGRQYRVAAADLQGLAGASGAPAMPAAARHRHAEVSSIVQLDAIPPDEAQRIVNRVGGAFRGRDRSTGTPLRVDTIHDESRGRLKIIITGSIATTATLLQMIEP